MARARVSYVPGLVKVYGKMSAKSSIFEDDVGD